LARRINGGELGEEMAASAIILGPEAENAALSRCSRDQAALVKAARLVIALYGDDAASYAAIRATLLQNRGNAMGASAWQRIAPVIEELDRARKDKSPI
jgi:hypothetical protein